MRAIYILLFLLMAVPASAQSACRGKQGFDLGDGAKGCIFAIEEGSITTTTTRDDGASSSSRRKVTPLVAAVMTGDYATKRSIVKRRLLGICKVAIEDVKKQFADRSFNRVILIMDWRANGGEIQNAFSDDRCRGLKFFGNG